MGTGSRTPGGLPPVLDGHQIDPWERLTPELVLVCPELARFDRSAATEPEVRLPALRTASPAPVRLPAAANPNAQESDRRADPRLSARVRLFLALTVLGLSTALVTAALTSAITSGKPRRSHPPPAAENPPPLEVPAVVGQPYVFAKGMLQDAGFAWRVEGEVQGFAANPVAAQEPPTDTLLLDTGAPTIVLRLNRSAEYPEQGTPENSSPYGGTDAVPVAEGAPAAAEPQAPDAQEAVAPVPAPAAPPADPEHRTPDFEVPGAPPEPADEMPLTERAFLLATWLADKPKPTRAARRHWSYQHAWIVTGARFGWKGGAEALRILIAIDRDLQARWGIGGQSEAIARAALREVREKARAR